VHQSRVSVQSDFVSDLYGALLFVHFSFLVEENGMYSKVDSGFLIGVHWFKFTLYLSSSVFRVGHTDFQRAENLTAYILHCSAGDCYTIKVYLCLLECSYAEDWEIRNKLSQPLTL